MKHESKYRISELFLVMADIERTFTGVIRRDKNPDDTPVCHGRVVVEEGEMCSMADTEDVLAHNLDELCRMKLDYDLHKSGGETEVIFGNEYFLN